MAITNKKTLEKMKKKNLLSIRVGKDGKVTNPGKDSKKKRVPIFESRKDKAIRLSTAAGKANRAASDTMKAAEKKYAKESMFKKAADARDKAKTTPGKARSFKDAFDAATKEGKSRFMVEGKSYLTTKGKREKRFDPTKTKAAPAGKEQRQILKRVKSMEKRKEAGKNYSAKNLAELTKKLEKLNIR